MLRAVENAVGYNAQKFKSGTCFETFPDLSANLAISVDRANMGN